MTNNALAASNASRPARSDSEDRAPRPERDKRVRPYRSPLRYACQGHGVWVAEENGRAYKIEPLASRTGREAGVRATAKRQRSAQVIATRDFLSAVDAKAWLDSLRLPGSA
jgi:hypothetical protein